MCLLVRVFDDVGGWVGWWVSFGLLVDVLAGGFVWGACFLVWVLLCFVCDVLFDLAVSCVVRYSGCWLFSLRFVYATGC